MTPTQIKEARQTLGLSTAGMARMLETDAQSVRRMEMNHGSTKRPLACRMERLIRAYLDGHRPDDWPKEK